MLKTFIVTSDIRFQRLLELEISDLVGGSVNSFGSYSDLSDHIFKYTVPEDDDITFIFDLDTEMPERAAQRLKRAYEKYKPRTVCFTYASKPAFDFLQGAEVFHRPFDMEKLTSKLSKPGASGSGVKNLSGEPADEIRLNDRTRTAYFRGEALELTLKEYSLLSYLFKMRGSAVSREQIYEAVWGEKNAAGSNSVDVYIRFLRSKIDDAYDVRLIHTVRGVGYTVR